MRRLVFLSALFAAFGLAHVASAQDFDAAGFDAAGEEAMLNRINALRVERQLQPLGRSGELDAVARAHTSDMLERGQLAHVSPETGTPEDRVRRAGVEAGVIAENVAFHRDAVQAQAALEASEAHLANLLNPSVTHVGLGSRANGRGVYVTQVFAQLSPPSAPAVASAPQPPVPDLVEAPVLADPEPPRPAFGIIPPFVEQVEQVEQVARGAVEAVTPEAGPQASTAPSAPVAEAPEADTAPDTASADATEATPPPAATQAALRQLIGLAQSLLGGAPAE
ncbi:MAG: hypothetical protein SangKO_034620 [Sandaracinaceae bacterium]